MLKMVFLGDVFFCKLDLLFTEFTVVTTCNIMSWDPSASCFLCPPAINVWDPRSNRMLALVAIGSESLGPVSIYVDLFAWWSSDVFWMVFMMVFLMVFWCLFDGFLMGFWWVFDGLLMVCWWLLMVFWGVFRDERNMLSVKLPACP